MRHERIAMLVRKPNGMAISPKTLRARFRQEPDEGGATVEATAYGKLIQLMNSKNDAVAFRAVAFYLQCRNYWRPAALVELTGADGEPRSR